ncbi:DUF3604 domain-containing protein [Vallitalea okinawensis]|uniref:DUF3604 domain-containing protein n=1 Tax=Vallitalea okinawensis TaxID=2078660 RepID=UPI000CFB07BA|nr:DUF3604 domain-containing protein [Vallitalea okinawensis]
MKEKLILTKNSNVVYPVEMINDEYVTYTESNCSNDGLASNSIVYIQNINSGEKVALMEGEDFSSPTSYCYRDIIYIAFTSYSQGEKSGYLIKCNGLVKEDEACVVGKGKNDNIELSVHNDKVYICWERCCEGRTKILMKNIGVELPIESLETAKEISVTKQWENGYKPAMISDGNYLYIAYESFFYNRYHILLRVVDKGTITDAIDIGSKNNNDQKHRMAIRQGRVIVVFENSWPLYKGYKWHDTVLMPGFGHGWKVETTMGMANVKYVNGHFDVKRLNDKKCKTPTILSDETKSAGCPYVYIDEQGVIFVSFVEMIIDNYGKRWEVRVKYFNGKCWVTFENNSISQLQRVATKIYRNDQDNCFRFVGINYDGELSEQREWTQNNQTMISAIYEIPMPIITDIVGYEWIDEEPKILKEIELLQVKRFETHGIEGHKNLYWGDLHMHTNLSCCSLGGSFHCVEIEDKYCFCKDVGQLDFAMITDHDSMDPQEWIRTKHRADAANIPGQFVAFQGFEWTCTHHTDKINFGHYNILYKGTGPLLKTTGENADRIDMVWDILKDTECLTIPHHPSDSSHLLNWEYFNEEKETLVEIFQVRGSYEYDDCEMNPNNYGREYKKNASVRYGLNLGYKFGFTSGGEHEGVGVTGVYADDLTREGIYNALKGRHTFGTTGDRIRLEFRVNGYLMGSDLGSMSGNVELTAKIFGTDLIDYIYIVKDGKEIKRYEGTGKDMEINWRDSSENIGEGHHYYYVGVRQMNDQMAWASPVFLSHQE